MAISFITNQVFPIVSEETLKRLEEKVHFEVWAGASETMDKSLNKTGGEKFKPVRFVTTWLTTDDEINSLLELI